MLVGMFWGAPLVAREIEHGTHRLVWTQGVSRLRWAATKIGLVSLAVLVMTAIYAGMLTWWITPVMQTSGQRFTYIFFDMDGIVVFGYALFALALGVFAGAVTGRMLPAMATTIVGFLGTRLLVMLAARARYLPTETRVLENIAFGPDIPQMRNDLSGDWIVNSRLQGRTLPLPRCSPSTPSATSGHSKPSKRRSSSPSPSGSSSPPSIGSADGSPDQAALQRRTAGSVEPQLFGSNNSTRLPEGSSSKI